MASLALTLALGKTARATKAIITEINDPNKPLPERNALLRALQWVEEYPEILGLKQNNTLQTSILLKVLQNAKQRINPRGDVVKETNALFNTITFLIETASKFVGSLTPEHPFYQALSKWENTMGRQLVPHLGKLPEDQLHTLRHGIHGHTLEQNMLIIQMHPDDVEHWLTYLQKTVPAWLNKRIHTYMKTMCPTKENGAELLLIAVPVQDVLIEHRVAIFETVSKGINNAMLDAFTEVSAPLRFTFLDTIPDSVQVVAEPASL